MAKRKIGIVHFGLYDGPQGTPHIGYLCYTKVRHDDDIVMDVRSAPTEEQAAVVEKAKKEGRLCPACGAVMTAFHAGTEKGFEEGFKRGSMVGLKLLKVMGKMGMPTEIINMSGIPGMSEEEHDKIEPPLKGGIFHPGTGSKH